jgi:thiol-disulfide isomerase/thioredoxin
MRSPNTLVYIISLLISIIALDGFAIDFLKPRKELIIVSASWCGPCQVVKKELENKNSLLREAAKHYNIKKYDFDVDKQVVKKYNVNKIPTFIIVNKDKEQARMVGIKQGIGDLVVFLLENEKGR